MWRVPTFLVTALKRLRTCQWSRKFSNVTFDLCVQEGKKPMYLEEANREGLYAWLVHQRTNEEDE